MPYHSTVQFSHNFSHRTLSEYPNPAFAQEVTDTHLASQHGLIPRQATRLYNALSWQGAYTYADVAALGLHRLCEESCCNRIAPLDIKHLRLLGRVFADQTGEALQKSRLPWQRFADVYSDLRTASPAVLLPARMDQYNYYAQHYMGTIAVSKRRLTIRDMINWHLSDRLPKNTITGVDLPGFVENCVLPAVDTF